MFRSFISKCIFYTFLFFLPSILSAQTETDTIRYTGPSICECVKLAKDDPQLLSRCQQKYDYNAMSSFQRSSFEEKIKACMSPNICDCEERAQYDIELKKVCDTTFNLSDMDSSELALHNTLRKECVVSKIEKPPLKLICDCVNQVDSDIGNTSCDDIWDITNLTNKERQQFVKEITQCIEHKDDPDFTLTICECINASEEDFDLKKRCIQKFDLNTLTVTEIKLLKSEMGDCSIQNGNDLDLICDCLKEERLSGKMSEACVKSLAGLEQKYASKSKTEMEEFVKQLLDCLSDF